MHILLTGATGYVGGRLAPRLLQAGHQVRCLVRDAQRLRGRPWADQVEIVQGDALDATSLAQATQGVEVAYYLIHGMQGGRVDVERELHVARTFAQAAEAQNVQRIIYLGELVHPTAPLSPYLRARHETGYILRQGKVPVTEFRAGMIVGSGSLLFEMIRYLVERQPILICPKWFFSQAQPIAIRNVLEYLIQALEKPESIGKLIEIGGAIRLSYAQMLLEYAAERGLKRHLIPTSVYAPRLSAYWVHMVTPVPWWAVLPLIEGLHTDLIVHHDLAKQLFPEIEPLDFRSAVRLALGRIARDDVETSWSDALVTTVGDVRPYTFKIEEGMMIERRQALVDLPAEALFRAYCGLGGERGWLYMDWAWEVRGWLDKLVGGVGTRRGRRHPDELRPGEALDFWRVEAIEAPRLLRLRAEMKVPGKAWLEFESVPQEGEKTCFQITAYFAPRGLGGLIYWYLLWPFHKFIFDGLMRKIIERAKTIHRERT